MPRAGKQPSEPETGFIAVGETRVSFAVFRSRKRKRTIAFRMEPDASLRVLAPAATSLNMLVRFLHSRAAWIEKRLAERQQTPPACAFGDGAPLRYLGHVCQLQVRQGLGRSSCQLLPRRLRVQVPENLTGLDLTQEVRFELLLWFKKRARALFRKRLDMWARRMDLSYKKMLVTEPAKRWGSCSADNVIRLNWRLIMAPLDVLDYVLVHELAHVRHKDHSPRFWACVAATLPDCQARRQNLRIFERERLF